MTDYCIICLDTTDVSSKVLSCSCKVYIHETCYTSWSNVHPSECPICRQNSDVIVLVDVAPFITVAPVAPVAPVEPCTYTNPIVFHIPERFKKVTYSLLTIFGTLGFVLILLNR